MKVRLKIKHPGSSSTESYVGSDGNIISKKIAGAMENRVLAMTGSAISDIAELQRERTLFLSAVFFQRVVNRTPVDEDYFFMDKNGEMQFHQKDDDVVRDYWTISYGGKKFTAKQFKEQGITFDRFNDESEIKKIFEILNSSFRKGRILTVRIENNHERFSMLEYGEYESDGELKRGQKYYHGVSGGYSVQAPYGMLRITEAEFQSMTLKSSTERLLKNYVRQSQRTQKVPSANRLKELKRIIGNKTNLTSDDISAVERIYK